MNCPLELTNKCICVYRLMGDMNEMNEIGKLYRRWSNLNISTRDLVSPFYQRAEDDTHHSTRCDPASQFAQSIFVSQTYTFLELSSICLSRPKKRVNSLWRRTIHSRAAGIVCKETCIELKRKENGMTKRKDGCVRKRKIWCVALAWRATTFCAMDCVCDLVHAYALPITGTLNPLNCHPIFLIRVHITKH